MNGDYVETSVEPRLKYLIECMINERCQFAVIDYTW